MVKNFNEWIKIKSSLSKHSEKGKRYKKGEESQKGQGKRGKCRRHLCLLTYSALCTPGPPGLHAPFQSKSESLLLTNFWEDILLSSSDSGLILLWTFSWISFFCRPLLLCLSPMFSSELPLEFLSSFHSSLSTLALGLSHDGILATWSISICTDQFFTLLLKQSCYHSIKREAPLRMFPTWRKG